MVGFRANICFHWNLGGGRRVGWQEEEFQRSHQLTRCGLCFSFFICQVGRVIAFHYVLKTYNANMHIMPLAECSKCSVSVPLVFLQPGCGSLVVCGCLSLDRMCASLEQVLFLFSLLLYPQHQEQCLSHTRHSEVSVG